jgi:hypothetical protein
VFAYPPPQPLIQAAYLFIRTPLLSVGCHQGLSGLLAAVLRLDRACRQQITYVLKLHIVHRLQYEPQELQFLCILSITYQAHGQVTQLKYMTER